MNGAFTFMASRSSCGCKLKSFFCPLSPIIQPEEYTEIISPNSLDFLIVMAIHCTVKGGELHIAKGNYRSCLFSALFLVCELKISTHHFLWWSGMENISTNVNVYLPLMCLFLLRLLLPHLICLEQSIFSQSDNSICLASTEVYMAGTYHPAKQSKGDLAAFSTMGVEKATWANWEKTITHNLPKLFSEVSSLLNSLGWRCT